MCMELRELFGTPVSVVIFWGRILWEPHRSTNTDRRRVVLFCSRSGSESWSVDGVSLEGQGHAASTLSLKQTPLTCFRSSAPAPASRSCAPGARHRGGRPTPPPAAGGNLSDAGGRSSPLRGAVPVAVGFQGGAVCVGDRSAAVVRFEPEKETPPAPFNQS